MRDGSQPRKLLHIPCILKDFIEHILGEAQAIHVAVYTWRQATEENLLESLFAKPLALILIHQGQG